MTIAQIQERIKIRISNMSAIKRRIRNVRTEQQRLNAAMELARVEREIQDLQRQKLELQIQERQGGARRRFAVSQ